MLSVSLVTPIDPVSLPQDSGTASVQLADNFDDPDIDGTLIEYDTVLGSWFVELFDTATPATVQNFLNYVQDNDWDDTIFHRSVENFVVQGGGFSVSETDQGQLDVERVPQDDPVVNEPGISNTRGTIAMAKLGGDPNSATNQWFFNLGDNSGNLDGQNGGFTVFGQVLGDGMNIVDAIAALDTEDGSNIDFPDSSAFTDLPVIDFDGEFDLDNFVIVEQIEEVGEVTFELLENDNPGLLTANVSQDGELQLDVQPGETGVAEITIRARDRFGNLTDETVQVSVGSTLSIADATVQENAETGQAELVFTVSRSGDTQGEVSVDFATEDLGVGDDFAIEGEDYEAASGTLTFQAGQTSQEIRVTVLGDAVSEADEQLGVTLSNADGSQILDGEAVGTILDDDALILNVADASVLEGNSGVSLLVFDVSLSAAAVDPVSVDFATGDVTAEASSDYTARSSTLVIPAGESAGTITVEVIGETEAEPDETLELTLSNISGAVFAGEVDDDDDPQTPPVPPETLTAIGTIRSDDLPALSFPDASVVEGDSGQRDLVFTLSLTAALDAAASVDFAATAQTATASTDTETGDFEPITGTVTIPAGATEAQIRIPINGDTEVEDDETLLVTLSNPVGVSPTRLQAVGTIEDDEPIQRVTATASDDSLEPGQSFSVQIVYDTEPTNEFLSGLAFRLHYDSRALSFESLDNVLQTALLQEQDPTADDSDFDNDPTTDEFVLVAWADITGGGWPGEGTLPADLYTTNFVAEPGFDGTEIRFSASSTASDHTFVGEPLSLTRQVSEGLSVADLSVAEDADQATFTVSLSEASDSTVSVDYSTADGTATAGEDYAAATGQITFEPGVTEQTVSVNLLDDTAIEGDETFSLVLSNPSNAVIGDGDGEATIQDDDARQLSIAGVSQVEGDDGTTNFVFTVSLDAPAVQPVSFRYSTQAGTATAGEDFVATTAIQTIPVGSSATTVIVPVVGDLLVEDDETFDVVLSEPTNAVIETAMATATIEDNDVAVVNIDDVEVEEADSEPRELTFTVSLTGELTEQVTVNWATRDGTALAGEDYTQASGTVSFAPGETEQTVTVQVLGDTVVEDDESLFVELTSPSGAELAGGVDALRGEGVIRDNDLPTITVADIELQEGGSGSRDATFTLQLSAISPRDITVDFAAVAGDGAGAATAGEDFEAVSDTATFPAGSTEIEVAVPVFGDTDSETNEFFLLELSNPDGAVLPDDPTAEATILNDDGELFPLNPGQPVSLTVDGVPTRITLRGPGSGEVLQAADDGQLLQINLEDTEFASSLVITSSGQDITLGDLIIDGDIQRVTAATTNLTGRLTISGVTRFLTLGDFTSGNNRIELGIELRGLLAFVTLGEVSDLVFQSQQPIQRLNVTQWLDTEGTAPDVITAPYIDSVFIRNTMAAGFDLTGELRPSNFALRQVQAGDIVGGTYTIETGSILNVISRGGISEAVFDLGENPIGQVLALGRMAESDFSVTANALNAVQTFGPSEVSLDVDRINFARFGLFTPNRVSLDITSAFASFVLVQGNLEDANLDFSETEPDRRSINTFQVLGETRNSSLSAGGSMLRLALLDAVDNFDVAIDGELLSLFLRDDAAELDFQAARATSVSILGSLVDSRFELTQPGNAANDPLSLSNMFVRDGVENSTLVSLGNIGSIFAGRFVSSALYAGGPGEPDNRFPQPEDFVRENPKANVRSFTLSRSDAGAFADSVLAAASFDVVTLQEVDLDNDGTAFGVVTDSIRRLFIRDAATGGILDLEDDNLGDFELRELEA